MHVANLRLSTTLRMLQLRFKTHKHFAFSEHSQYFQTTEILSNTKLRTDIPKNVKLHELYIGESLKFHNGRRWLSSRVTPLQTETYVGNLLKTRKMSLFRAKAQKKKAEKAAKARLKALARSTNKGYRKKKKKKSPSKFFWIYGDTNKSRQHESMLLRKTYIAAKVAKRNYNYESLSKRTSGFKDFIKLARDKHKESLSEPV